MKASIIALVGLIWLAGQASAQEYCVVCKDPEATYRCSLKATKPAGMPLKLLCITTMAREGGHGSCSVQGGTVFDCRGPLKVVHVPGEASGKEPAPPPTEARSQGREDQGKAAATASQGPPPGGPAQASPIGAAPATKPPEKAAAEAARKPKREGSAQTVEQLAKEVSKSSGQSLKKAGKAIESGSKKAWKCLSSLFQSC